MILLSLMALTLFNFLYATYLIVLDTRSLLVIPVLALGYIIYFAIITRKPEQAVYMALLIFCFFPRSGNNYGIIVVDEIPEVSLYIIFQSIASFTICIRLVRTKILNQHISGKLRTFWLLISLAVIEAFIFALLRYFLGDPWGLPFSSEELITFAPMLNGVIFLSGCIAYITEIKQIERVFMIFILSGVEIFLEAILYAILKLPLPFAERVIEPKGRFISFTYVDFSAIGLVCLSATGGILYFAVSRKQYKLLCLVPLFLIPISKTFERTPLIAFVMLILIYFVFIGYLKRRTAALLMVGVISVFLVYAFGTQYGYGTRLKRFFEGEVRPDYFESYRDSGLSRLGAIARSIDVILYTFPFGTGPGLNRLNNLNSSPKIPAYSQSVLPNVAPAQQTYEKMVSGEYPTRSHALYFDMIEEYGVLGLMSVWVFVTGSIANLRQWLRWRRRQAQLGSQFALIQTVGYSVTIGLAIIFMALPCYLYYLWFFFFYLTFSSPTRNIDKEDGYA